MHIIILGRYLYRILYNTIWVHILLNVNNLSQQSYNMFLSALAYVCVQ